ncbi:MAG: hypothetical protein ABR549_06760 [Mycobacteriales bacterium]
MRRPAITGLALAGCLTAAVGVAAPAQAAAGVPAPLLQSNWYWHHLQADAPVAGLPELPEPSNVPAGDLPVASTDGKGTPSKLSFVAFSLPAGPVTVDDFTLKLTVDPAATNVTTDTPKIAVALPTRTWLNGPGGEQDTSSAPSLHETTAVVGTPSADGKTFSFALPALAQEWLDDTNVGLAIVPAPGYTTPFQLSFLGGAKVAATIAVTPQTVIEPPSTAPVPEAAPPPSLGGSPGGAVSPPVGNGSPPLVAGAQPQPAPQLGPVAPVTSQRALPEVSSRPTAALAWTGVLLAALLLLISVVLGGEPVAAAQSRSRLQRVLRARSAAALPASAAAPASPARRRVRSLFHSTA